MIQEGRRIEKMRFKICLIEGFVWEGVAATKLVLRNFAIPEL